MVEVDLLLALYFVLASIGVLAELHGVLDSPPLPDSPVVAMTNYRCKEKCNILAIGN